MSLKKKSTSLSSFPWQILSLLHACEWVWASKLLISVRQQKVPTCMEHHQAVAGNVDWKVNFLPKLFPAPVVGGPPHHVCVYHFTGLLAKKAVNAGLRVKPYIKTSLSPGSGVVTYYLRESGVMPYLSQLGWGKIFFYAIAFVVFYSTCFLLGHLVIDVSLYEDI